MGSHDGVRQKESGALIFPVHPKEIEAQQDRAKLKEELDKAQELNKRMEELIKQMEDKKE